jgi:hypothetical protein
MQIMKLTDEKIKRRSEIDSLLKNNDSSITETTKDIIDKVGLFAKNNKISPNRSFNNFKNYLGVTKRISFIF